MIVGDRPGIRLDRFLASVLGDYSRSQLQRLIKEGQVRYAFLNTTCGRHGSALNPACSAPAKWIRAHGTDVSSKAGLEPKVLWLLPGAQP